MRRQMWCYRGAPKDDNFPNPLVVTWTQVSGPASVWFDNIHQTNTTVHFPGLGTYVLRLNADDGAVVVSDDVTFSIQRTLTSTPVTLVSKGSVWKYLDNGTDQGSAWRAPGFADGTWAAGAAPLGYGDANGQLPATVNNYGPDPNNKYVTTYYRQSFNVANAAAMNNLVLNVQRDDGIVVYLNGVPVMTNNMPTSAINYQTFAVATIGGIDETTFIPQSVPNGLLVNGANVLAAEIHQVSTNSSDIIFDLEFTGETLPANQAPAVNAGVDQSVAFPAAATLNATVSDDGLPLPPGMLGLTWSKFSGPGNVSFGNANSARTTAAFSTGGTYVLQLSASDGALTTTDQVTVTVTGQSLPLRIESAQFTGGAGAGLHIRFNANAGQSYGVEYRNSLSSGSWTTLTNIPPQATESVD